MAATQLTKEQKEQLANPEPSAWRDTLVSSFNTLCHDFRVLKDKYGDNPEAVFEFSKFEQSLNAVSDNVTAVRDGAVARVRAIEVVDPGPPPTKTTVPTTATANATKK